MNGAELKTQTLGSFIVESEVYEHTSEYLDMIKECYELMLLEKVIDTSDYILEHSELSSDLFDTFITESKNLINFDEANIFKKAVGYVADKIVPDRPEIANLNKKQQKDVDPPTKPKNNPNDVPKENYDKTFAKRPDRDPAELTAVKNNVTERKKNILGQIAKFFRWIGDAIVTGFTKLKGVVIKLYEKMSEMHELSRDLTLEQKSAIKSLDIITKRNNDPNSGLKIVSENEDDIIPVKVNKPYPKIVQTMNALKAADAFGSFEKMAMYAANEVLVKIPECCTELSDWISELNTILSKFYKSGKLNIDQLNKKITSAKDKTTKIVLSRAEIDDICTHNVEVARKLKELTAYFGSDESKVKFSAAPADSFTQLHSVTAQLYKAAGLTTKLYFRYIGNVNASIETFHEVNKAIKDIIKNNPA